MEIRSSRCSLGSRCVREMRQPGVVTAAGCLLALWFSAPAVSQERAAEATAQPNARLEEVVVTGSRIRRQDFTANSPIATVTSETFEQTSTIGIETVLNQLPQFVPGVTQFTTTDVQNTATNTALAT